MRVRLRAGVVLLASLTLADCGSPPVRPAGAPATVGPATSPEADSGSPFRVLTQSSALRVRVHREGALAAAGHNHALVFRPATGRFLISPDRSAVRGELQFDVASVSIDDPAERAAAGPDFPGVIPEGDIAGTRHNLLGPQVLDSERWPTITVTVTGVDRTDAATAVHAVLTVRDRRTEVTVPLAVTANGNDLRVVGELSISQRALGLEPFSVLFGALRVADRLDMQVDVLLTADPGRGGGPGGS